MSFFKPLLCLISAFIITAAAGFAAFAAESDLDTSYTPSVTIASGGLTIFSVVAQTDGKSVIGGTFTSVNGQPRTRIARLNADGTLDGTFSSTLAPNGTIFDMKIQSDGKIIAVGNFTTVNGTAHLRIVRINTDGTVDATFNSAVGADNQVLCIALQSDGKILIGGDFLNFGATAQKYIARLNTDGTLDTTFVPANIVPATASGVVYVIAPLPDGTIYFGGGFSSVGGSARNFIARLTATGANDAAFNPGTGPNSFINSILPLPSGQVMVGGSFNAWGAANRLGVVRLSSTGTLDGTFNANLLNGSANVYNILPQAGGKFLLAGSLTALSSNGAGSGFRRGIIRVDATGAADAAFNVNVGTNGTINSTAIQPDGKILVGGQYLSYNGIAQAPYARLNGAPATAAGVTVSGRVSVYGGRGLSGAYVSIRDQQGNERLAMTGTRGMFRFDDVESGPIYVIAVRSRRFQFEPKIVSVTDDLANVDFVWSASSEKDERIKTRETIARPASDSKIVLIKPR